jgi:uncharacterized protein YprB with RNaseH-like and TPR domain
VTILEHTFIHIRGLKTADKERALWERGIKNHEDLLRSGLLPASAGQADWYAQTKRAIAEGDHDYFAERLPRDQHYRVAMAFPKETAFLDIETTGLSRQYDQITIVGWSLGGDFKVMVYGRDDPLELTRDLGQAKALVTFNGKTFDVPFLNRSFTDLAIPKAHVDLRYLCKKVGLNGGQKSIEREIGLRRLEGDGDGRMAVALWYAYKGGRNDQSRKKALKDLIIYNFADVNAMKLIFDACLERLARRGHLPQHYGDHFKPLSRRPDFENSFPFSLEPF